MHRKHIRFNTQVIHTAETELSSTSLSKNLRYHLQSERCSYFSFSEKGKILSLTVLTIVLWSEARHAASRQSSAPLCDATLGSAFHCPCYILSMT